MSKQEFFKDDAGEWRYRVVARNGEVLVSSEGYTLKKDAERGLKTLKDTLAALPEDQDLVFDSSGRTGVADQKVELEHGETAD